MSLAEYSSVGRISVSESIWLGRSFLHYFIFGRYDFVLFNKSLYLIFVLTSNLMCAIWLLGGGGVQEIYGFFV